MTLRSYFFYFIGILVLTLGIALSILSNLGTSPYDALLVGLFRTVGLTVGSWEIIVALLMMYLNAMMIRKRPEYLALVTAFITGASIDFWYFTLREWLHPLSYFSQFSFLAAGLLLIGFGTALYLQGNTALIPLDRLMLIVTEKTGWKLSTSRLVISIVVLSLAFFLNGPIGIGTLLTALLIGYTIATFLPFAKQLYHKRKTNIT